MNGPAFVQVAEQGVRYHVLPTEKFKTNTVVVNVQLPLAEETVTPAALLPFVLKRGSQTYPTTKALQRRLDELYGASLEVDVAKRGERQILQFRLEVANEAYLTDPVPLLTETLAVLRDVLTRPVVEDGALASAFVASEKERLRKRLESLLDDKIRYASQRCTEEMCREEPYRLFAYGRKEGLAAITPQSLYDLYQDLFARYPIDVFLVGDVDPDRAQHALGKLFDGLSRRPKDTLPPTVIKTAVAERRTVVERLDVTQGKLNIGCRTPVTIADADAYPALLVYNGVLGGFPHSKLFVNVREKASLAYYAASRLDSHKGILMIFSGIAIENFEKALAIIEEQLALLRRGEITDDELQRTKASLANQYRELLDNPRQLIDFAYHSVLAERPITVDGLIEGIMGVTKDDVVRIAEGVVVDTVYFLRDRGNES
ncbi:EF-P 5-aminopentanol modification-associated protein YfmF [Calditerricola satsumensis]|uniref:EF-P 5-aminopentanol modification-associated protein YfmF n=1 Tax=Calditerricola satsumensis TaxID=373054 RepID=UPI000A6EEB66|nr:pitrilysin family protein [Calditerricola satsumensis]